MRRPLFNHLQLACAALTFAASACAGPPPGPPIVLHHAAAAAPAHPRPRPVEPCETPVQAKLTEAQKASLLQEFDAWERDRRPAGIPADTALPPPGPLPKTKTTVSRGCPRTSP